MYIYVCVCVCLHTIDVHRHICFCVCVYIMYVFMCVHLHTRTHTRAYIDTPTHTRTYIYFTHTHTPIYLCMYMYVHICVCLCVYICTHTYSSYCYPSVAFQVGSLFKSMLSRMLYAKWIDSLILILGALSKKWVVQVGRPCGWFIWRESILWSTLDHLMHEQAKGNLKGIWNLTNFGVVRSWTLAFLLLPVYRDHRHL